ncbi:MAG: Branched-chain amino acid transport ATP-binding protein LivG, partial [uncultured Microvirga sp.]
EPADRRGHRHRLRGRQGGRRRGIFRRGGRGAVDHRAEWRWQDDAVQHRVRRLPGPARTRVAGWCGGDRAGAGPACRERSLAHLSEPADLHPHDGLRERDGRMPSAPTRVAHRRTAAPARGRAAEPGNAGGRHAAARFRRSRAQRRNARGFAALWGAQASRACARARHRAKGSPARRAGSRVQRGGNRDDREADPGHRRTRDRGRSGRARH